MNGTLNRDVLGIDSAARGGDWKHDDTGMGKLLPCLSSQIACTVRYLNYRCDLIELKGVVELIELNEHLRGVSQSQLYQSISNRMIRGQGLRSLLPGITRL